MFLLGDVDPHHYPLSQRISRNASLEVSSYELVNFRLIALQVATSLQRVDWGMRLVRLLASPFGRRVSSLAGGEKRDSEESHLLKTVASGGPWHSYEQGEEALLPGSKIGPKCRRLAWAEAPVASRGAK